MKYKFKAFVGPIILLLFLFICFMSLHSFENKEIGQCGYDSCQPQMPLIYAILENPGSDSLFSKISHALYMSGKSGIIFLPTVLLLIINIFNGFSAKRNYKNLLEINSSEFQEKYIRSLRSINKIFKLTFIITMIPSLIFLLNAIQVRNPDSFCQEIWAPNDTPPDYGHWRLPPGC
jgi:hypothetical protein